MWQVVKVRGESMANAARMGPPHGMLSIIGLNDADVEAVCKDVRTRLGPDTICQMANYLFPQVCSLLQMWAESRISIWGPCCDLCCHALQSCIFQGLHKILAKE